MDRSINQSPEQIARDNIDKQLHVTGWAVQDKDKIDWNESIGIAVREYQTDVGPADYVLGNSQIIIYPHHQFYLLIS